ncbi:lanthionine synthetase LanC family protein [Kitasatospora sp. NPDC086801]|uniref:lanthionine synthetase LanC family protein n=1 Tax=Kitasatospora sp. NPDC086801 TaxID=3364066 RepID=UPI00380B714C
MNTTDPIRAVAESLSRPGALEEPAAEGGGASATTPPAAPPAAAHTLGAGRSGAALALAVLADREDDPALRRAAHGHLAAAVKSPGAMRGGGLFSGAAAIAFAARTMARRPGEYRTLLDGLAPRVRQAAAGRVADLRADLAAGAGLRAHTFDTVSGAAGLGRLLLALEPDGPVLADLLAALVALAEPTGGVLPRWWTAGGPGLPGAAPGFPRGHLNLGLAHGVPGPLALLALARLRGVHVPGQDEAIEALASWLAARRVPGPVAPVGSAPTDPASTDPASTELDPTEPDPTGRGAAGGRPGVGGSWPMTLRVEDEEAGRLPADQPTRAAWCYGTPGAARALFLAGAARGRSDWRTTAVAALTDTLRDPAGWNLQGPGLCHGTGGLLRIAQRMAEESGSAELAAHLPALAATVAGQLDTALGAGDPPGLLEGTAGAALALHAHACAPARTAAQASSAGTGDAAEEWDAFLLIR